MSVEILRTPTTQPCILLPYLENVELTEQALADAQAQHVPDCDPPRVILVNHGGPADRLTALKPTPTLFPLHASPPWGSLAALWNSMLTLVWNLGHDDCLVINNDIRMGPWMYARLRNAATRADLWLVSAANTNDPDAATWKPEPPPLPDPLTPALGGPDFSCFLIRRELHQQIRFDPRFSPAYFEDNDYVRQVWLAGLGARVAGVPLPYYHLGSATINRSPEAAAAFAPKFERNRARYVQKWGGLPHQERKIHPDSAEDLEGVGTPGGWTAGVPALPQEADRG